MQRRLLMGAGVALVAPVLLIAGSVLALSGDKLPVASVAEVVPNDVIAFVRTQGLDARFTTMKNTQAWKDLKNSLLVNMALDQARASGDLEGFEGMLAERAERLGLPASLETYMQFVGHDLGFGVRLDRETGQPSMITLYRVDSIGLMKSLAAENPAALAKVLTERYFGDAEGAPVATNYGGYDVFAMGEEAYYTLLRDIFVASDSLATVKRSIDLANAGGLGSLGKSKAYTDEMARLGEDTLLSVFVDVQRLRDPELLKKFAGPRFTGKGLEALDRAVKPFPAIAVGISAAGSDLYQAKLTVSRNAEDLLVDRASPDLHALVPTNGAAFLEIQDFRGLVGGFKDSALFARALSSPLGKKVMSVIDQPGRMQEVFGIDAELPPFPADATTLFERTLLLRALGGALDLVAPGSFAIGIDVPAQDAETPIPPASLAIKLSPLHQVVEAFFTAFATETIAMDGNEDGEVVITAAGARSVFTLSESEGHWDDAADDWVVDRVVPVVSLTRIGDTLLVGTDIAGVAAHATAPPTTDHKAFGEVAPGYWGALRGDYQKIATLIEMTGERDLEPMVQMMRTSGTATIAWTGYVKDGFTTFENVWGGTFDPNADSPFVAMYVQETGPIASAAKHPGNAVVAYGARLNPKAILPMIRQVVPPADLGELDEALGQIKEMIGVDIEAELIPALGTEFCFSIAPQSAPEGAIPVPAFSITLNLNDRAIVEKAIQGFLAETLPEPPVDATEADLARMPHYAEVAVGDATLHLIDPPAREAEKMGGTVRPGFTFLGDTLMISSSAQALEGAAAGSATGLFGGAAVQRASARLSVEASSGYVLVDLAGFALALKAYAPLIAQSIPVPPPAGLAPPEYPREGGDMEQWERDYEAYNAAYEAHRREEAKKNAVRFADGCDHAAEWVDYWSYSYQIDGSNVTARDVFKLKAGE